MIFLKFIQKNRRSVPSKERIADKDKFIKTVYELSNSFEIDADLIEFAEGYIANIYVDYACYTGYIKKLLARKVQKDCKVPRKILLLVLKTERI